MQRTLSALRVCAQVMERHRVSHARCVATEACRRAANGPEFMERARRATGIELELLDQEDEARLAMLGCLPLVEPEADQVVMVDIGGGSTEVMWLDRLRRFPADRIGHAVSLPLGVVTLSESLGHDGGAAGYAAMVDHVAERCSRPGPPCPPPGAVGPRAADDRHLGHGDDPGGRPPRLHRYDRRRVDGVRLGFRAVDAVAATLRGAFQRRARRASLHRRGPRRPGRRRLRHPGRGAPLWPVEGLRVADRGLREGILASSSGPA